MASLVKPVQKSDAAHSDNIWVVEWNNSFVLTGSLDGAVKLWSKECSLLASSSSRKYGVTSIVATKDGTSAVAAYQDGFVRFLDLPTLRDSGCIEPGLMEAWAVCLSPNDDVLVSGTQRGSVNIWSMAEGHERVATLETHNKFILSTAFSVDAKLATSGIDGFVNVFDINTQQIVHKLEAHSLPCRSIAFSPDGSLIYSASDDRHVSVFDTVSGTVVNTFSQTSLAFSVDSSPDHRHFAVGCSDHTVSLWDLGMQRRIHSFEQHKDQVWDVSFDKADTTGKRFASVGDDSLLQVYE